MIPLTYELIPEIWEEHDVAQSRARHPSHVDQSGVVQRREVRLTAEHVSQKYQIDDLSLAVWFQRFGNEQQSPTADRNPAFFAQLALRRFREGFTGFKSTTR